MIIEKLELRHQDLLTEKIRGLNLPFSEYSFANLYLFRELHKYQVIIDEEIFILGITKDQEAFLMPIFWP